jgi:multidrug efflux system outer membrane protein
MNLRFITALFCLGQICLLNACTLAPEYIRPDAPVPPEWPKGQAYNAEEQQGDSPFGGALRWEEFFTDDHLRTLIALALANNRDLRIAALNVELSRALYGIQRDALYPSVYATGNASKTRASGQLTEPGQTRSSERYSLSLGSIAWEIDFFGRIRSLKDKALEEYIASEHAQSSAQILLVSAVADAYLALAADRENLALAESTLQTQKATFSMVQRQFDLGIANDLSLRQAQTQVETARRAVAGYTQQVARDENALTILLGGIPVPRELLPSDLGSISPLRNISAGTSSEVLLSRPDVLQAEAALRAVNAEIGAARAAFFPRITLTTSYGTASEELGGLFNSHTGTWSYAPQITMPIFDARTWSALKATKVQREIAVTNYERTVQNAFREVADALAVRGTVNEQLAAQQALVDALAEVHRLSLQRYEKGIDSYLSALDAQRFLFAGQQALIGFHLASLASQVRFYAVLGGGAQ